jgi:hypothetical protein
MTSRELPEALGMSRTDVVSWCQVHALLGRQRELHVA